jgi:hypothetical protein
MCVALFQVVGQRRVSCMASALHKEMDMRPLKAVLLVLISISAADEVSAAKSGPSPVYPKELQGTWDLGQGSCKLPIDPDLDAPIRVETARLMGYEHQEAPVSIERVSESPLAWRVSATSDNAPGITTDDLYIVKNDHLTISDGEATRKYRRCR